MDFVAPGTAAHQASLSIANSQSLLRLISIESVMPSNHLILCRLLLLLPSIFPRIMSFLMSQFFTSGGQRIVASASASLLPMNSQGWFPLGLIGLISLQFKGLSSVFSSTHNLNISKIILVVTCRSNKTTKPNQKINSQVLNHLDSGLWHCPGRQAPGEKKITICCFLKTSQPQVFGSEFSLWFSYGFALLPRLIISEVVTFKSF